MHKVCYILVAGAMFWMGVAIGEASKPVEPFKRVSPIPQKLNLNLFPCDAHGKQEYERTCRAKVHSMRTKPL